MNEILRMLNTLTADELDGVILRAGIMLEKKRKEEAEEAIREKERQRLEKIEQEKRRQEEIAELQRKLKELQSQKIDIPEEPSAVELIPCPSCHLMNVAGSQFCANCGQKLAVEKAAPKPAQIACPHCHDLNDADSQFCSNCGQRMTAAKTAPQPQAAPAPQPQAPAAQVRYADEFMKKWEMLPGEKTVRADHEIVLLQPDGGKYAYYMEVTNKRVLLTRESSGSKNAGLVARMGGGIVGSLIAEGIKSAAGAGPKPWLEIPLEAISNCGCQNKREFFIVADQTYVLKNKDYEEFLPELVLNARNK